LNTIPWKLIHLPKLLDLTGVRFLRIVLPRLVVNVGVSYINSKLLDKHIDKLYYLFNLLGDGFVGESSCSIVVSLPVSS